MDNEKKLTWEEFTKVDIRIGTIIKAEEFKGLNKPAYKIQIDFGEIGIRKTSAQLTKLYNPDDLIGKQILAVINFPNKQIKNFMSECLILGAIGQKGEVILVETERKTINGLKIG
jgi:tRNA-binding protein